MQSANTAKNSSPWNPSNLSVCVVHFLFPTGCTASVAQVSLGWIQRWTLLCFLIFLLIPSLQSLPGECLCGKRQLLTIFLATWAVLSVTTSTDGSCRQDRWRGGWGELGSAARLLLAATRTCRCLLRSHSLSPPYSSRPAWHDRRRWDFYRITPFSHLSSDQSLQGVGGLRRFWTWTLWGDSPPLPSLCPQESQVFAPLVSQSPAVRSPSWSRDGRLRVGIPGDRRDDRGLLPEGVALGVLREYLERRSHHQCQVTCYSHHCLLMLHYLLLLSCQHLNTFCFKII